MLDHLDLKAAITIDDAGAITGTAWPFGTPDRVGDVIGRDAFKGVALPLPMLFQHDPELPVGVWEESDASGEGFTVKGRLLIDSVEKAREAHALVKARAITGLSIGFRTLKAAPRNGGGRTISAIDLVEISLVTVPAHPGARITSAKDFNPASASARAIADALTRATTALCTKRN